MRRNPLPRVLQQNLTEIYARTQDKPEEQKWIIVPDFSAAAVICNIVDESRKYCRAQIRQAHKDHPVLEIAAGILTVGVGSVNAVMLRLYGADVDFSVPVRECAKVVKRWQARRLPHTHLREFNRSARQAYKAAAPMMSDGSGFTLQAPELK